MTSIRPFDGDLDALLATVGVAGPDELPLVISTDTVSAGMQAPKSRASVSRMPPSLANATEMISRFQTHLDAHKVNLDENTKIDLLAAFQSSQFLLFAGPSGTGKSTAAMTLATFFADASARTTLYSRRQLLGPEDLSGYFSPLSDTFAEGSDLAALRRISGDFTEASTPILVVEEINLSPPEGYLNPLIHALSGLSAKRVQWPLFAEAHEGKLGQRSSLTFAPFLRVLGTINVDATAPAPARKVAARACVVLLEPTLVSRLDDVVASLTSTSSAAVVEGAGAPFAGDPLEIFRSADVRVDESGRALMLLAAAMEYGAAAFDVDFDSDVKPLRTVTRRQLSQMLTYTTWFDLLARSAGHPSDDSTARMGAENALLHHLLPSLDAHGFSRALESLERVQENLSTKGSSTLGGTLLDRVRRLRADSGYGGLAGLSLDFWDRLS